MKYIKIIFLEPIIIITFVPSILFLLIMILFKDIFPVKIGFLHSNRLGHFAANTELYILKKKKFKIKSLDLFYLGRKEISNMYLKKLWEKELNILPYSLLRALDLIIRSSPLKKIFSCNYISNTDRDLHSLYENYSPTISISKNDKKKLLQKFNLKDDDKIVCVNLRDGTYLKTIYDPKYHNLNHHNYRDCKIENFKETINYLLDLNYKVFRVGVKKENFLDINHKNYFDRSYTLNREDYIDVLLAENCQFCISTGSGFDALPRIFRKPILFVNLLPIINYHSFCKKDLTICKHLYDSKKLSIQDIFYRRFYDGLDTDFYLKNSLQVVENSSKEILIVTKEMIARLNNDFILTKDNLDLQKLIKNKIQNLSKDKFKHGKLLSDFGEDYLRKNFYD